MTESTVLDETSDLDYEFGWRWLLPLRDDDTLAFFGLDSRSVEWWQYHNEEVSPGEEADGVLLAVDELSQGTIDQALVPSSHRWLCAWGEGRLVERVAESLVDFRCVKQYAMLPATLPRVIVPLGSSQVVADGLRLHRPGRRIARIMLGLAGVLARIGCNGLLKRKLLLIACRDEYNPVGASVLASHLSMPDIEDFALYLGSADGNRKTVALPVPVTKMNGVIKSAEKAKACNALRNEANTLSSIRETGLSHQVPELLSVEDGSSQVSIVQEYRRACSVGRSRQHRAVLEFLSLLTEINFRETSLRVFLESVPATMPKEYTPLLQRVQSLSLDTSVYCHRSHGDFAPWNCSWSKRGFFVYDWEESKVSDLALSDAIYYTVAPLMHVDNSVDGRRALRVSMAFTRELVLQSSLKAVDCRLYMALWLLRQSSSQALYLNMAVALLEDWS